MLPLSILLGLVLLSNSAGLALPLLAGKAENGLGWYFFLPFGNSFAGGILLGTAFVHVLGEAYTIAVQAAFEQDKDGILRSGALVEPNFLCVIGIMIPFFLEKSGLSFWIIQHALKYPHGHIVKSSLSLYANDINIEQIDTTEEERLSFYTSHDKYSSENHIEEHSCKLSVKSDSGILPQCKSTSGTTCIVPSLSSVLLQNRVDMLRRQGSTGVIAHADMIYEDESHTKVEYSRHNHRSFASVLMIVVLSVHSLIAGMTIGAAQSQMKSNTPLFGFCLHKIFEGLVLGIQHADQPILISSVFWFSCYIFATPIGLFISQLVTFNSLQQMRLLSLTAGNFIYIALIEIIGEEFEAENYRVLKFLCFAAGVSCSTSVVFLEG